MSTIIAMINIITIVVTIIMITIIMKIAKGYDYKNITVVRKAIISIILILISYYMHIYVLINRSVLI